MQHHPAERQAGICWTGTAPEVENPLFGAGHGLNIRRLAGSRMPGFCVSRSPARVEIFRSSEIRWNEKYYPVLDAATVARLAMQRGGAARRQRGQSPHTPSESPCP